MKLIDTLCSLKEGESLLTDNFDLEELFELKKYIITKDCKFIPSNWNKFLITAKINKDIEMTTWDGKHPVNFDKHICKKGSDIIVWMVSRIGDIGITDNFINPSGYDARGIEFTDLYEWKFTKKIILP